MMFAYLSTKISVAAVCDDKFFLLAWICIFLTLFFFGFRRTNSPEARSLTVDFSYIWKMHAKFHTGEMKEIKITFGCL